MDNCDPDYVAVYDVEIDRDEPKIKLCGRQATMVRTIGNHMNLKLVASSPAAGFNAHYQLPACGGLFTGNSGNITNALLDQRHNSQCIYLVETSPHHRIKFNFTDDFNVPCYNGDGDSLEVVEYSTEGYFLMKEVKSGKYIAKEGICPGDCIRLVALNHDAPEMGLLWYWDHQHIRSVENFDFALSTKDGVVARDGIEITGENFDPSAIGQKWEFKDGTITPAVMSTKAEKLVITAQDAKQVVSRQNPDSDGQLFDSEMTQVGKGIGNYCSPDHSPTQTYSSRGKRL